MPPDVTDQRRVAAIVRTAANLASQDSLTAILDALAAEVLQADALAGVQILTLDSMGSRLRIMGSAGFRHWPDFFDRLMECRQRGATLHMLDAFQRAEPVVIANRWAVIQDDPAWKPLRDYLAELEWNSFASVPLLTRGRAVGVLNAFFAPGQTVGSRTRCGSQSQTATSRLASSAAATGRHPPRRAFLDLFSAERHVALPPGAALAGAVLPAVCSALSLA